MDSTKSFGIKLNRTQINASSKRFESAPQKKDINIQELLEGSDDDELQSSFSMPIQNIFAAGHSDSDANEEEEEEDKRDNNNESLSPDSNTNPTKFEMNNQNNEKKEENSSGYSSSDDENPSFFALKSNKENANQAFQPNDFNSFSDFASKSSSDTDNVRRKASQNKTILSNNLKSIKSKQKDQTDPFNRLFQSQMVHRSTKPSYKHDDSDNSSDSASKSSSGTDDLRCEASKNKTKLSNNLKSTKSKKKDQTDPFNRLSQSQMVNRPNKLTNKYDDNDNSSDSSSKPSSDADNTRHNISRRKPKVNELENSVISKKKQPVHNARKIANKSDYSYDSSDSASDDLKRSNKRRVAINQNSDRNDKLRKLKQISALSRSEMVHYSPKFIQKEDSSENFSDVEDMKHPRNKKKKLTSLSNNRSKTYYDKADSSNNESDYSDYEQSDSNDDQIPIYPGRILNMRHFKFLKSQKLDTNRKVNVITLIMYEKTQKSSRSTKESKSKKIDYDYDDDYEYAYDDY